MIGGAYDFLFNESRFTLAANFQSNAFTKDQFTLGGEFALRKYLMLRASYTYENGITNKADRTTLYTGPSAGITVAVPFGKDKEQSFSIDYSYRSTDPFDGIHSIGARFDL